MGVISWTLGLLRVGAGAFAEELMFRGYLVSRLERVMSSKVWAVITGAAAFGICHLYQGKAGFMAATLFGAMMCVAFVTIRRVWPLSVGHALLNLQILSFSPWPELSGDDLRRPPPSEPAAW
jgi:membrane protease YdiL (CAAX protease family)